MGRVMWSDDDVHSLINHIEGNITTFTTGVKSTFYTSFISVSKTPFTTIQVKTKCMDLERKYKLWKDKFSASGFGLEDTDAPSFVEMLSSKFPYFHRMDEIFGHRSNITPPVHLESCPSIENSKTENSMDSTHPGIDDMCGGLSARLSPDPAETPSSGETPLKKKRRTKEPTIAELMISCDEKKMAFLKQKHETEAALTSSRDCNRLRVEERRLAFEEKKFDREEEQRERQSQQAYELEKMRLELANKRLEFEMSRAQSP
jgi:hypothetical protein